MTTNFEIEELARHLCGVDLDDDETDIDDAIYEKFEIPFDGFSKLIKALMPMIVVAESPLTLTTYRGFAITKDRTFLIKQPVL